MKLCVPIPCFYKCDPIEAIYQIAALGFHAVESYDWKSLDIDGVRAACQESGVSFLSVCTTEFRMTDPAYRAAFLSGLEESCAAAVRLGATRLITQVGNDTGAPREAQHASIREACLAATPILEKYGITLMLEPLNTLVNHPGYYLTSAKEAFAIIREVNHPLVKVVYDIYHQQVTEGNIIPNVTENLDCIAHLHAAGHPGRNEPWLGESDYRNIFRAIEKAGYTGYCGLEYRPLFAPEDSLEQALALYGD